MRRCENVLKKKDIPSSVFRALEPYEENKRESIFFQLKVFYKDRYYFSCSLAPPLEYLVIRDDGTIPLYDEARPVSLLAIEFNTKDNNLNGIGKEWLNPSTKMMYENLLNILRQLEDKVNMVAPSDVIRSLNKFREMTEFSIKQQEEIMKTVKEGLQYLESINKKGVLVEDDVNYLDLNKDETMRALNRKQLNQMESDVDRKKILSFLFKRMWRKPVLFFYLLSLIRYQKNLRSNKGSEAEEQRKLKKRLDNGGGSPEQEEEDKDILNRILNPK